MFVLQSQNSQDSAVRLGAVALWKGRSSCRLAAFRHGTSQGWILPPAFPRFSCFLMFFFKASVLEWLPTFPHSYWNPFPGMRNRMVDQRAAGQSQKHPPQRERLELWVFDATYLYIYIYYIYIGFFLAETDCTTSTMTSLLAALVVAPTVDQFSGVFSLCYQYSLRSLLLLKIARNWWELGSLHCSNPSRQGPWPEIIFMEHEALTRLWQSQSSNHVLGSSTSGLNKVQFKAGCLLVAPLFVSRIESCKTVQENESQTELSRSSLEHW